MLAAAITCFASEYLFFILGLIIGNVNINNAVDAGLEGQLLLIAAMCCFLAEIGLFCASFPNLKIDSKRRLAINTIIASGIGILIGAAPFIMMLKALI